MIIEQERKIQCFKANCQYANRLCIIYHGYDCIRLGGTKIPTHRSLGYNTSIDGLGHSMKPKFVDGGMTDGRANGEGR